jgi:hypothetical protein
VWAEDAYSKLSNNECPLREIVGNVPPSTRANRSDIASAALSMQSRWQSAASGNCSSIDKLAESLRADLTEFKLKSQGCEETTGTIGGPPEGTLEKTDTVGIKRRAPGVDLSVPVISLFGGDVTIGISGNFSDLGPDPGAGSDRSSNNYHQSIQNGTV